MEPKYNIRTFIHKNNQILIRVRYNKREVTFSTGLLGDPDRWSKIDQRAINGTSHKVGDKTQTARSINTRITAFIDAIDHVLKEYSLKDVYPETDEFKDAVNLILGRVKNEEQEEKNLTLAHLIDEYTKQAGKDRAWTVSVYKKFNSFKELMISFDKDVRADTIDTKWMSAFRDWFIMHGYRNRTIVKYFSFFQWFLKWLEHEKLLTNINVRSYRTNLDVIPKSVSYLNYEELIQFYKYEFPAEKKYLDRARDAWCFMAFTSLRVSDLSALRWANLKDGALHIVTQKTADNLVIDLNTHALEIVKKYETPHLPSDNLFPFATGQKLNDYIKEAAQLAGIDKDFVDVYFIGKKRHTEVKPFYEIISNHDARRTFICCSLRMGIPPTTVMKWTGHKDYESMKPYIETDRKELQEKMSLWDEKSDTLEKINLRLKNLSEADLNDILAYVIKKAELYG